jgi:hypothetical protein
MKNLYFTICSVLLGAVSFAQNGQIENGGFENWTNTVLYDYLVDWTDSNIDDFRGIAVTNKSVDAQLGTYSVEISAAEVGPTPDTTFGYVFHGVIGQNGPSGGMSYTSNFDEVRFQYKSDIPAGDTLYLLYFRFDAGGNEVDSDIIPAAYGNVSTWTQGSISVPAIAQTELFIGFVMGDPFGTSAPSPGSWARIDNVEMYNSGTVTTALPDPSFENWSSQTVETADQWYTMNELLSGQGLENAVKTTDANTGAYAIEMTNYLDIQSTDTIRSVMSMGPIDFYSSMNPFMLAPYSATPTTFSGAYKYAGVNGDQGNISIEFYDNGALIGAHHEPLTDQATYSTFSSPLTIVGTPDSIRFLVFAGNNPGTVLKLDDLSFSGGNVGLDEFASMSIKIYPNPATNVVMIKNSETTYSYQLIDLTGKTLMTGENVSGVQQLNVEHLSSGCYVIQISNTTGFETHQLIIE